MFVNGIKFLSPILLAGCSSTKDPGGSTSGSGSGGSGSGSASDSGSGSGGSSGGGEQEEYDPKDYFAGYKFSYRPASGNEKQSIIDVRNQNYQFTLEVMEELYETYGHAINMRSLGGMQIQADVIACDDDGNVVVTRYGKSVFENGTNPRYSKNYFLKLKDIYDNMQGIHIEITNTGVLQIVNPNNTSSVLAQFDPNAEYGQYFSYENAIYKDSPRIGRKSDDYSQEVGDEDIESIESVAEENRTYRRWKMSIAETANLNAVEKAKIAQDFLNNHRFRAKIQFAITLITAGYDISPSGNGRSVYDNGCGYIDTAFDATLVGKFDAEAVKIAFANASEIKNFYEDIEENLFAQYEKWIDHSGFTASEQQQIANYVCDDVIGTNLVKRDNNRFVNVYQTFERPYYRLPISRDKNLKDKYSRFLTDDNLFSAFIKYSTDGIYSDSDVNKASYFYNSEDNTVSRQVRDFLDYISYALLNTRWDTEYVLNSDFKYSNSTFSIPEIGNQLFEAYDLDCDGVYHGDRYDANGDGNTEIFVYEANALDVSGNPRSTVPAMIYSLRLQFFKNYANTALDIVTSLAEKTTQVENSDGEMESELVYPRIPACDYANYSCGDLLANDDKSSENYGELFHMKAGYQNYQNMVLMPKKNVTFNSMWVSFKSNRDSSDAGFNIVVYARYYDATTNSYATWTQNGEETQFYNCGSQTVKNFDNDDFEFLEIDTESILSSAKIDGAEKGNAMLSPFVNPTGMETFYNTQIITRSSAGGKYYEYIELPDGNCVCVFNETKVPKSQKSSYFELIFSTGLANAYQVGLPFLDFE